MVSTMERLPLELVYSILQQSIRLARSNKNELMQLRLVCKKWDEVLREYVCKTTQVEFSRLVRGEPTPDASVVPNFGHLVQALHFDMMVIRDQEELDRLTTVFNPIFEKLPEMRALIDHLSSFCLRDGGWNEAHFRQLMEAVLQNTPNLTKVKLNLPFQVIGRTSQTATLLLANTFDCLAKRPVSEDFRPIETLVIDHITDSTTINICRNPIDLQNALTVFEHLKNLVITFKVQESYGHGRPFASYIWHLINQAQDLESLCIFGWCTKRTTTRRRRETRNYSNWMAKSLAYNVKGPKRLQQLKYLELKRIDVEPDALMRLIGENCASLKELYLNEVHLKVTSGRDNLQTSLWIGPHPVVPKGMHAKWIAVELRNMPGLNLNILRVSNLGYDDYTDLVRDEVMFDLQDPLGLDRSFDERFVATVLGIEPGPSRYLQGYIGFYDPEPVVAAAQEGEPTSNITPEANQRPTALVQRLRKIEYDAETFQRHRNTTSHWKQSIDGHFQNHNQKALLELDKIIKVADRGMDLLSAEITHLYATPMEQVTQPTPTTTPVPTAPTSLLALPAPTAPTALPAPTAPAT